MQMQILMVSKAYYLLLESILGLILSLTNIKFISTIQTSNYPYLFRSVVTLFVKNNKGKFTS